MDSSGRQSMLEMYVFETVQMIEQLEDVLIGSEQSGQLTIDAINEVFRIMHTIKGSSAMMEYDQLALLAHSLEDLFDVMRKQPDLVVDTSLLTDQVLQAADFFKAETAKAEAGETLDSAPDHLIDDIKDFRQTLLANAAAVAGSSTAESQKTDQEKPALDDGLSDSLPAKEVLDKSQTSDDQLSEDQITNEQASEEKISEEQSLDNQASEDQQINAKKPQEQTIQIDLGDQGPDCYTAKIYFENDVQMENMHAFTIVHNLENHVTDLWYFPEDIAENEATAEVIQKQGFQLYFKAYESEDDLYAILDQSLFLERLEFDKISQMPDFIRQSDSNDDIKSDTETLSSDLARPDDSDQINVLNQDRAMPQNSNPNKAEDQDANQIHKQKGDSMQQTAAENIKKSLARLAEAKSQMNTIRTQSVISVHINKLDTLMDLVGELVISEAMVTHNPELDGLELDGFHKAARQLNKLTTELQDIVMSIRMVPVAATFQKMQRIVRDMTRKLGKTVLLELSGEETEVDKSIIDQLADPLMHLIRNSLDHGIEVPETRQAAGKPTEGKIQLEARNAGSDVWITVRDDGKGMDPQLILDKAKQKGLLDRPETEYSEKEIYSLIMLPGFSTKEEVSEFSGRGVGMDVVRQNIEKIGGSVTIESEIGKGSAFIIRIPLTLAIIDGMLLSVGESRYILPITSIRESFRPAKEQIIVDSEGNEMLMIRGDCINVKRLHQAFNAKTSVQDLDQGILIIVEDDDRTVCLFADALLGEQQVVVKPLPTYIKKTGGLAGCTILGDGSISLILDVGGLLS